MDGLTALSELSELSELRLCPVSGPDSGLSSGSGLQSLSRPGARPRPPVLHLTTPQLNPPLAPYGHHGFVL